MAVTGETGRPLLRWRRWRRPRFDAWTAGAVLLALIVASPIVAVAVMALASDEGVWLHLVSTVMPGYLLNTLLLALGVGVGVLFVGIGPAWLVSVCRFPGRGIFRMGALAAARCAGVCHRLRLYRLAGICRAIADGVARSLRLAVHARLLVSQYPNHRRRCRDDDAGLLPICLSAHPRRLRQPVGLPAGGQPRSGPRRLGQFLHRRPADGAPGDRRRPVAGADGDAGRFRHGAVFRGRHLHHRHLPGLAGRQRAGGGADGGDSDPAGPRSDLDRAPLAPFPALSPDHHALPRTAGL